jgi:hypothetical protein
MPDPVFTPEERVETPPKPVVPARVVTAPPAKDKTTFWNDPDKATRDIVREEAQKIVTDMRNDPNNAAVQASLVGAAKLQMKDKHPDFGKFAAEVEELVMKTGGTAATQVQFWETCYNYIKGQKYDADVQAAEARGRMPAEAVQAAAREPDKKPEISYVVGEGGKSEAQVAEGLGLSAETYMKGKHDMEHDIWPLTVDNRRKR